MFDLTALQNTKPTAQEAARFLNHATWGFNRTELAALMAQGYASWFDAQVAISHEHVPGHLNWLKTYYPVGLQTDSNASYLLNYSILRRVAEGKDLLRQKMAFALSQILVVSGKVDYIHTNQHIAMGSYMDLLALNAFGSYPELLSKVSLTTIMANYLTYLGSSKKAGNVSPDENFAREIHQLFTVGVDALDVATGGTITKGNGDLEEAYTIEHIREVARLFTGFGHNAKDNLIAFYSPDNQHGQVDLRTGTPEQDIAGADADDFQDLRAKGLTSLTLSYPYYEEGQPKNHVITVDFTATPRKRVAEFVSKLALHPNVSFVLGRHLIQRFVTSNPSAAYVRRVAKAYRDSAGNLGATLKAVLFDESLFDGNKRRLAGFSATSPDFGKVREPYARLTQWVRLFGARSKSGKWFAGTHAAGPQHANQLGQAPLMANSVFNFYRPNYAYPGGVEARLPAPSPEAVWGGRRVAPELQLVNEYTSLSYIKTMWRNLDPEWGVGQGKDVVSSYSEWAAKASNPQLLVAELNLMLCAGRLNPTAANKVVEALGVMPGSTDVDRRKRVQAAAFLIMIAPEYIVQK